MSASPLHALFGHVPSSQEVKQLLDDLDDQPEENWTSLAEAAFEWAAEQDDYDLAFLALKRGCRHEVDRIKRCAQAGQTQAARAVANRENRWGDGLLYAVLFEQWTTATHFLDDLDAQRLRSPNILGSFMEKAHAPLALGQRLIERFLRQAPEAPVSANDLWLHELDDALRHLAGPHALTWGQALLNACPHPVPEDTGEAALFNQLLSNRADVACLMVPLTSPEAFRLTRLNAAHLATLDLAVRDQSRPLRDAWLAEEAFEDLLPLSRVRTQQEDEALARQDQAALRPPERTRRRRPT